jgi:hypothetical protein
MTKFRGDEGVSDFMRWLLYLMATLIIVGFIGGFLMGLLI